MYYIICKVSVPGYHNWPDAPEEVSFLRDRHRHVFEIACKIPVNHDDRDKEIILTENAIRSFLLEDYGAQDGHIYLGSMSCERLAAIIAREFGCMEVTVLEDGYGGGGYVR